MKRRRLIKRSLSITQRSDMGTTNTNLNVWSSSGPLSPGSTITQSQRTVEGDYEALRSVLLNISESVLATQQRKYLEDLDTLKSIADTKAALVALYNSIGYTAGISELLDNEKEGV